MQTSITHPQIKKFTQLVSLSFSLPATIIVFSQAVSAGENDEETMVLDTIVVEGQAPKTLGPMEGLQLSKEQIPGNIQSLSSKEIKDALATSLGDLMNSKLQSVNVNDYQGNPFQMDITYRSFSASPQLGTPQGLSVFVDGVRVNEPFGDIVNWDLIPMNALSGMDVFPGSNPLFGLNTLGGALALRTKNGFDDTGVNITFQGGSWDRKKGELSAGWNNGKFGAFIAFTGFDEEGWRVNSPSQVNQGFARLDWREENFSLRFSTLLAGNDLLGNGLIPTDLYHQNPSAVFTSPDRTQNELQQYTLGGEFFIDDEWSLTGQIYRRESSRSSIAGDIYQDFDDLDESDLSRPGKPYLQIPVFPVCRYRDRNHDNKPDYYIQTDTDGDGFITDDDKIDPSTINKTNLTQQDINYIELLPPIETLCTKVGYEETTGPRDGASGDNTDPISTDPKHSPSGVVEGTPIGVLSKTDIGQMMDGASLQLNFNSEQHKFMIGGSVDAANTDFITRQRLGLIDANHRVYTDPANIDPIFVAGKEDILNNSFLGKSATFSGYLNETFSP